MVCLLSALDEGIEFDESVGSTRGIEVLLLLVCLCELGGQVGKVGKSELARVGFVAYAQKAQVVLDDVAEA